MEVDDVAASAANDTASKAERHDSGIEKNGGSCGDSSLSKSNSNRRISSIRKKFTSPNVKLDERGKMKIAKVAHHHSGIVESKNEGERYKHKTENNNKRRRSSSTSALAAQLTEFSTTEDDGDVEEIDDSSYLSNEVNSRHKKHAHASSQNRINSAPLDNNGKFHKTNAGGKVTPQNQKDPKPLTAVDSCRKSIIGKKYKHYDMRKYPSDECLLGYDENGEPEFGDIEEMMELVSGGNDGSNSDLELSEVYAESLSQRKTEKEVKENEESDILTSLGDQFCIKSETPPILKKEKMETARKSPSSTKIPTKEKISPLVTNETNKTVKTDEPQSIDRSVEMINTKVSEEQITAEITAEEHRSPVPPIAAAHKPRSPQDDYYKKPFEYGWKRELVYRANMETSKDKADVYFITPTGKKLRTRNDILPLLEGDLTIDHFSFAKEPLGAGSDVETVRSAKPTTRTSIAAATVNSPYTDRNAVSGKRISKPKLPKGASPPPQGWVPTRVLKNSSSLLNSSSNKIVRSNSVTAPITPPSNRGTPKTPKTKRNGNIGGNFRHEPCTIMCPSAMGLIPQLQCVKCLCLYHHECVGLDRNDAEYRVYTDTGGRSGLHATKGSKDYICESCIPDGTKEQSKNQSKLQETTDNNMTNVAVATTKSRETIDSFPQTIAVVKGKKYVMVARPPAPQIPLAPSSSLAENTPAHGQIENEIRNSPIHNSLDISSKRNNDTYGDYIHNSRREYVQDNQGTVNNSMISGGSSAVSFATNFFANVSFGYDAIMCVLKYLKIDERPRAARVCRIWNLVAKDTTLWRTVRMKNSKVHNWSGFAAALRRGETKHLDLRKMLIPSTKTEEMWNEFSRHIGTVCSLEIIDMCRCPAKAVESLFQNCRNLRILSAVSINDDTINLNNIDKMEELTELRLRANQWFTLDGDLSPFRSLKNIVRLSLTSIRNLGTKIDVLGEIITLKSLELGECGDFDSKFTDGVLPKLINLQRLRMENGQETCDTLEILDSVSKMEKLTQLEFVNFDIKPEFDIKIMNCTNIRKLLVIPTYISQSATTNSVVLQAVLNLKDTLEAFTWGVTLELLRVTALYVDQCDVSKKDDRSPQVNCIPVLKPVPGADVKGSPETPLGPNAVPQIEILTLEKVRTILADNLITKKFAVVEVPYAATWKQHLVE